MHGPRLFVILALLAATVSSGGAGRDLAPRAIAPTAYFATNPDVAYAGGRFLSLWTEEMGSLGRPVKGALLDSHGRRLSSEAFTILESPTTWVQIVGAGDRFALFWRGTDDTRYLTWIDRDGRVSPARALDLPASVYANAAWNGSRFLVALWGPAYEEPAASAVLLDGEANVLLANIPTVGEVRTLTPSASGFLLFSTFPKVLVQHVSNGGEAREPIEIGPLSFERMDPVAARRSDGSVLVAWSSIGAAAISEVRTAVIASDGSIVQPPRAIYTSETAIQVRHLMPTDDGALLVLTRGTPAQGQRLVTMMLDPTGSATSAPGADGPLVGRIAAANDEALTVVTGEIGQPWGLRVGSVTIRANGMVTPRQDVSVVPARQTVPLLASGAWRLLAFWADFEGDAAWLRTASISPDGEVVRRSTVGAGFTASEDVAWNGSMYLALHLEADLLHARRLTADGEAIDAQPFVLSPYPHQTWQDPNAHSIWSGTAWLVASQGPDGILMTAVSPAGVAGPARTLDVLGTPPAGWFASGTPAGLAFDGERALLVWKESHSDGCVFPICPPWIETMRAQLLDDSGKPVGEAIDLPMLRIVEEGAVDVAVATSGSEFVVIGEGGGVVVTRTGDTLQIAGSRELRGVGDIFWDGVSYVHAYRSRFVQALEIARYGRALEPIGEARYVAALKPDDPAATRVSVAGLAGRPALVATSEGTATTGARARTYSEEEFGTLPAPPEMPRNVRTRRLDDGRFLTTWDPPLNGNFEAYRYEERTITGEPRRSGSLAPDVEFLIGSQPIVQVRTVNAYGLSGVAVRRRAVSR